LLLEVANHPYFRIPYRPPFSPTLFTDIVGDLGNAGLGKETILQLAQLSPSRIYLAARDATKAREAIASIQGNLSFPVDIRHIPLDLSSFKSIREAAEHFCSQCDRLDILILNAGTMANPPELTMEGFEIQFGTNHIGHFLLTTLLLPTLQRTVASASAEPDVRVVTLSSMANQTAPSFEVMTSTSALLATHTLLRYSASKAANVLFASELARRYPEILSVSVHPGVVSSELYRHTSAMNAVSKFGLGIISNFFRSIRTGTMNQLWAAGAKRELLVNGAYYVPIGVRGSSRFADDAEMAQQLWEWTENQIAERS
jgi:NAD(P)-dependent dehydrogenase (short-subunit alcohol dehydrogenase family)